MTGGVKGIEFLQDNGKDPLAEPDEIAAMVLFRPSPESAGLPDGNRSPLAAACTWTDLTDCVLRNIAHDFGPPPNLSNPDDSM